MFGGLTKTSSRIAIAAALGLTLGGFAFKASPAQAADLGGDCCADLEERVAELARMLGGDGETARRHARTLLGGHAGR